MPDPVTATIGAGASIVSGVMGGRSAESAAETQADAQLATAAQSEALNRERYGEAVSYMTPYIEREAAASEQLMYEMGMGPNPNVGGGRAYMDAPGYQEMMSGLDAVQGEQIAAVNQGAANVGTLYSGRRGEALSEVGAGTQLAKASTQNQFYTNYMNMLQNLGSPSSTTNLSSLGVNQAATIGGQNIAAQNAASATSLQGTAARSAGYADAFGGAANIGAAYMQSPQYAYNSGAMTVPTSTTMPSAAYPQGVITPTAYLQ